MNGKKVGTYAGMGVLAFALLYGASTQTKNNNYSGAEYGLEAMTEYDGIEYAAPDGYHLEGKKAIRNPRVLVDASYVPEDGYHLEQYEFDDNLFYVIEDGFHNENGYKVKDGYHLEGNKMVKNNYSKTLKFK